ncbi:MAG: hypothetical protein K1X83_10785 [Oligoflexia bacterium]|nr:hypothetical protein [Oligoflexia bacterium]
MNTVLACAAIMLTLTMWVLPVARYTLSKRQREYELQLRAFKLYAIKHYHPAFKLDPELSKLSYTEIQERFDIEATYDTIS